MNGNRESIKALLGGMPGVGKAHGAELVVCAPFPYLALCANLLTGSAVGLGAQDVSAHAEGAYTGETSAGMLREFGCRYALIGHSERRAYHHESEASIASKTLRALAAGLTPIVCVGENLQEQQSRQTNVALRQQVLAVTEKLPPELLSRLVIAYEPVWAIGSGKSASPETAQQAHEVIRRYVAPSTRILYGGSVKADNASQLVAMPDIDGLLIGGASLNAKEFVAIAERCNSTLHQGERSSI
jgi:triosephosphate isomerase